MADLCRRRLLAGAAAGGAVLAAMTPAVANGTPAAANTQHPDTELLVAYAEFRTIAREYASPGAGDCDDSQLDAVYERYSAKRDAIIAMRANTPAGAAVKALTALHSCGHLGDQDNSRTWDGFTRPTDFLADDMRDELLWSIVQDGGLGASGGEV
jgi:hypothetical protein